MTVHNGKNSARADHTRHDRLLVTRFAMNDAYASEQDEARTLVGSCPGCAALAAEIQLLAAAMKDLPAPRRTRDFTITQEQAEKLSGSRLERMLRGVATPRWATLRPVAGVALSIGLVMALAGSALPRNSPASITADDSAGTQEQTFSAPALEAPRPGALASPKAAMTNAPELAMPNSAQGDGVAVPDMAALEATEDPATRSLNNAYVGASPAPARDTMTRDAPAPAPEAAAPADNASRVEPTRNLLIYAGLAIALISLAVLIVAWSARRYFADPLFR